MNSQNAQLYAECRKELLSRQLSNSEKYDSAILTLSMAALGVSLTFLSEIVPLEITEHQWLLKVSWGLFVFSISLVIISFQTSNQAINKHILFAEKYYLEDKDDYANKRSVWSKTTTLLNMVSGSVFILAIIFTIFFVTANLNRITEVNMTDKNTKICTGGAEVPAMQMKPSATKKGQEVPAMQPKPSVDSGNTNTGNNNTR